MLPPREETRVQQNVIKSKFVAGQILQEPGQGLLDVFFLESGLASVMAPYGKGSFVEVAQVGPEAMAGMSALLETDTASFNTITVQVAGEGYRMPTEALHRILASAPVMRQRLNKAFEVLFVEVSQAAVCNAHDTVINRLSRWLLMTSDKSNNRDLRFTQQSLCVLLGLRRPSISIALKVLSEVGGIAQQRGHIVIQDRSKLEAETCECYFRLRDFAKTAKKGTAN